MLQQLIKEVPEQERPTRRYFISDAIEEGSDSGASIERNPDNLASILEWGRRLLQSQDATQASSSRQQHTAEERWRASLEIEIGRTRKHYNEQEKILEREVATREARAELRVGDQAVRKGEERRRGFSRR